jgi:hypothetical protein
MLDEAERASRKAMAVIAPETNETNEVGIFCLLNQIHYLKNRWATVLMKVLQKQKEKMI